MTIIAYLYSDPMLATPCDPSIWGLEIEHIYQDVGNREQLQQLIADCQTNQANYLLLRRLDELGDSVEEICDRVTTIEGLGVNIITTEQPYSSHKGNDNTNQGLSQEYAQLWQEIINHQRSLQLRRGHAQNRIQALPPPGKAPYGYRRGKDHYILDRSTAPIVKDFCERFLLFGSLRGAVRYLEQKYAKKISVSTGKRWLTHPVYRGDLSYHNGEIIPDTHLSIISREEAAQIDRLLRSNSRLPSRTASAPRSLAGLVVCQQCQSRLKICHVTRRDQPQEYLYLRPLGCPQKPQCKAIPYQQILDKTIERICQELPLAVANMNAPDLNMIKAQLNQQITQKEQIIQQLPQLVTQGILDTETSQWRNYKLKTEITQLRAKIDQLPPINLSAIAQTVSIPQFWLDLSEAERRFYLREFIRQIEILRLDHINWQINLIFIF